MKEEFLHHIWKYGLFNKNDLVTTNGYPVTLLQTGTQNHHAGPDFFNARVNINGTTWVGNVEIHVFEKEWVRHGHQNDKAYDNVVLHVVYKADGVTLNTAGKEIPVVELNARIARRQIDLYRSFQNSKKTIPCEGMLPQVDRILRESWLERMVVERIERKSLGLLDRLQHHKGDWQQTMFEQIAVSFGFKVNAQPMEMLARSIPVKLLAKYKHNRILLEALFFGQAGFLNSNYSDTYPQLLQNEYAFLSHKHELVPLDMKVWKFGRMRPHNFPTIRLAQLAGLIYETRGLFAQIIDQPDAVKLLSLFDISSSEYWQSHYHFEKINAKVSSGLLGKSSRYGLLINTVVPLLFAYSKNTDNALHQDVGMEILELLPEEKNSVVNKMTEIGFGGGNAARSQALLELKSQYCDDKKCLNCAIGAQLLKSANND